MSTSSPSSIQHHFDVVQRTDEWFALRHGILTASDVSKILTSKRLQPAKNDTFYDYVCDLATQRLYGYIEPSFSNEHTERGQFEEVLACTEYEKQTGKTLTHCGIIIREIDGISIGFSPDGLVDEDGFIEIKSRLNRKQMAVLLHQNMPDMYRLQVQTGLLVSGRKWCDFTSYSNGMPMFIQRIESDPVVQEAIVKAALALEEHVQSILTTYQRTTHHLTPVAHRNYKALLDQQHEIQV